MTRLIFKLSEVENILSKAHVEESVPKQDPKNALVQFIKVLYIFVLAHRRIIFFLSEKKLCIRFFVHAKLPKPNERLSKFIYSNVFVFSGCW